MMIAKDIGMLDSLCLVRLHLQLINAVRLPWPGIAQTTVFTSLVGRMGP